MIVDQELREQLIWILNIPNLWQSVYMMYGSNAKITITPYRAAEIISEASCIDVIPIPHDVSSLLLSQINRDNELQVMVIRMNIFKFAEPVKKCYYLFVLGEENDILEYKLTANNYF